MPDTDGGDEVVLVDEQGVAIGTAPRLDTHHAHTPRHLAFSLYLFDERRRVLLTRRALSKRTWPGVWSNACCGHPRPGEDQGAAVTRRVHEELGLDVAQPRLVLPRFSYRAVDASGVVENELCPVWVATIAADSVIAPDPDEVLDVAWADWDALRATAARLPEVLSPWSVLQVRALHDARALGAGTAEPDEHR